MPLPSPLTDAMPRTSVRRVADEAFFFNGQLLSSQIDRLLRRLKEELPINPIEICELRDANDAQKKFLKDREQSSPMFERCGMAQCDEPAVSLVSPNRRLCCGHAEQLNTLLGAKQP